MWSLRESFESLFFMILILFGALNLIIVGFLKLTLEDKLFMELVGISFELCLLVAGLILLVF